jgi:hypothetical protein
MHPNPTLNAGYASGQSFAANVTTFLSSQCAVGGIPAGVANAIGGGTITMCYV